jgi:uncharacterized protein (UPF0261 family)
VGHAGSDGRARDIERNQVSQPEILIIGTLDTKSVEIGVVADCVESLGASVLLLDTSGRAHPGRSSADLAFGRPVITREEAAAAAGKKSGEVEALPRGESVAVMRIGVARHVKRLYSERAIDGAICIGGAGAYVARDAFAALPVGFPKLIVSPLASGNRIFEPYVGTRDVAILHSVADIVGVNPVTSAIYRTAAGYIVGAARAAVPLADSGSGQTVVISMNGNTTPALVLAKEALERTGRSIVAFHANGVGGRALEEFVATGAAVAVLDYTTTELAGREIGGLMDAGPDRMETAGKLGIPQVLVPGCLDFITCGPKSSAEAEFPGRKMFMHNPELTLVRLTADEMSEMGRIFAEKANRAIGPVVVCVPLRGLSVNDAEGGLFWDPVADEAFTQALRKYLEPKVTVHLLPQHINDEQFVDRVLEELLSILPGLDRAARVGDDSPPRSFADR